MARRAKATPLNYARELIVAAKSMILVREPDTLIRLIARIIVQKVKVTHAAILLHQAEHDTFVLGVSRGPKGLRIPAGYARMDKDSALIRFFIEQRVSPHFTDGALLYAEALRFVTHHRRHSLRQLVCEALEQMRIFDVRVCIPCYFRGALLGILMLGEKKNRARFGKAEIRFFSALASDVAMGLQNARLFQELHNELAKKRSLFMNTTHALAAAIEAKDLYTHGHTSRVTAVSLTIASKLNDCLAPALRDTFLENLTIASLLHDVGKIGIPERILNKAGPLDEDERRQMQQHPQVGVNILTPISGLGESMDGVKHHHEHYDGSGYPEGLSGKQIPLIASIIAVADAFDAMTSDRPYRPKMTKHDAVQEIVRLSGKDFDPDVVKAFAALAQEEKW